MGAGAAGVILGPGMAGGGASRLPDVAGLDSHFRDLSGLLLGIGLAFRSLIPGIARHRRAFRLLTGLVAVGGLARLGGVVTHGLPPPSLLFGLAMERLVTPLLCVRQARLAR